MAVTNETYRVQVTLTGSGQAIPLPFYFLEDGDLAVFKTVAGVDTLLVLNTNYTVAGAGDPEGGMIAMIGGTNGDVITVARSDALTQEEEFLYMGALSPSAITRGYDRVVMQLQRLLSMAKRSIRFPVTNAEGGELSLTARMGKLLGFNATTGAVELVDGTSLVEETAANAAAAAVSAENAALSEAAAAAFAGVAYTTLTGGTPNALDSAITAGGVTPTGSVRYVQTGSVAGGDLAIQIWILQAGTNAEDGVSYVRPDDYNGATNAKVWVRVG